MLSTSGKIHEKCKRIKPLNEMQRQKVYGYCQFSISSPKIKQGQKKFSPFNTISRQSRNSYLLRVTNQPNQNTNYQVNLQPVMKKQRRSTIDRAQFKRIIGPVNQNDYSIKINTNRDHRCAQSLLQCSVPKPLTTRDIFKWRKTFQNIDFQKQVNPEKNYLHDYLNSAKSTHEQFMVEALKQTTQSNFNNFKRFSLQPKRKRAHDFNSDSGHKFLSHIYNRNIEPQYSTLQSNQEIIRKSMRKPKGQIRFDLFREKIVTRVDRADPHWNQTLEYQEKIDSSRGGQKNATLDFQLMPSRCENQVRSKYPMRQSLRIQVPKNMTK